MRFKGIHRKPRRGGAAGEDAAFTSPTGPPVERVPEPRRVRPRSNQPRDRFGRFRKAGRDDDFALDPDGPAVRDLGRDGPRRRPDPGGDARPPRLTWEDFELGDDAPARAEPHPPGVPHVPDGRRHCGVLEKVIHRQWDVRQGPPPPETIRAVESLAALPDRLKRKLADGLAGIYVGPGGVPDLDHMGHLRDRPLPSGRATWDICAGAYGDGKIVVGDRPSPTPDVMMHEVGHALDDIDGGEGEWTSDSPAFQELYRQCLPYLASDFHRQPGTLGRREFFADAFAAISARQRPALVDMLAGNIRLALEVMLFFNRRYGI
ncbi:hypothetical protein ACSNOI_07955 [Actinomadura kijaniata]|uniref:hypothetical protein n=1 Tax=Actinomadura kijaniata TaxID=46161 RepID=UPI003F1DDCFC